MKVSIFTTITNPEARGDNFDDAIECYLNLADEIIIVNGGDPNYLDQQLAYDYAKVINYEWPKEFNWTLIGQQFQRGYEACTGDWVLHMDLDFLFHQKDFAKIRQALRDYPSSPAVSFYKWQFIQPDRYNLKSRLVLAVNKAAFGDRIKFDGGGESDLCQPSVDGKLIDLNETPQAGIAFYNYEHILKTKEQITEDVGRMDRAYFRHFGKYQYGDGTDEQAYKGWCHMVMGRNAKPAQHIPLSDHPKYIQETIKNLKPENFGYNGFGMFEDSDYVKSN